MPQPAPAAGTPPATDQPPFGSSSATAPSPNKGYEAAALQRLGLVVKQLEELIPLAGAATDVGKAALDALNKLVKLVPSGSVSPASEKNNIEQMAMRNAQGNQQMQALKQQRMGGQPSGAAQPGGMPA